MIGVKNLRGTRGFVNLVTGTRLIESDCKGDDAASGDPGEGGDGEAIDACREKDSDRAIGDQMSRDCRFEEAACAAGREVGCRCRGFLLRKSPERVTLEWHD